MPQILRGRRYKGPYSTSEAGIARSESPASSASGSTLHQCRSSSRCPPSSKERRSVGHPSRIPPTGNTPPGRTTTASSALPIFAVASLNGLPSLSPPHHVSRFSSSGGRQATRLRRLRYLGPKTFFREEIRNLSDAPPAPGA